ncbi:putative two-component system response regulator [Actinoplanes missouriensis 431]|uniref:Putative two-component system response regulator n=1 Tax=Actinoplanes missouriensis (strain ATCC 14538 / DSM 43046 / CBS 188.64 / JCM 3121 / NBRC 102363 / NCIMB 12654 / NRRL B-3342 / UNCC 431) TaxID=512565 RepID=I0HBW9_ACTM4|nr:response regulator transcription factor [Actinoplanes missouriensis]BAL90506.1 putative two-component system response regulator [Actinoplanes missouriensis 431]
MSLRVVIVDDHPMFRMGVRSLILSLNGLEVAGEAAGHAAALEVVAATRPDVVLMDLHLGGDSGVDATADLLRRDPGARVLVLTMLDDDDSVFAAMRAGARGYLLKNASPEELERAVHAVANGDVILSGPVAQRALGFLTGARVGGSPFPELTSRELDVLDLVARGLDNLAVARRLSLSDKTVRNYLSAILAKLRVADRSQVIVRAREAGLGGAR